ncbi:MAG: hemolysin [Mycobacterium sp.]|nr:hemolysin [Mycobacterium sp.]
MGLPLYNGDILNDRTSATSTTIYGRAGPQTPSRASDRAATVVDDDLPQNTSVDDDLPQVLADTVTDFLGRPRARGWIHFCSAAAAIVAGVALVSAAWIASSPQAVVAALIYTATIVAMFSFSALYHRVHWHSPTTLKWMKRIDHSLIFVFIAGSFTPFAMLAMPPQTGAQVLVMVWSGAAAGVALKMWWPSAPRWVGVPLYLLLGYTAIWFAGTLLDGAGLAAVVLLAAGGVLYNIGAVLYGVRWPNPWPRTFGYHEFFHAFTAAAAVCHYIAIWFVVV